MENGPPATFLDSDIEVVVMDDGNVSVTTDTMSAAEDAQGDFTPVEADAETETAEQAGETDNGDDPSPDADDAEATDENVEPTEEPGNDGDHPPDADDAKRTAEPVRMLYRHDCEYACCAPRWSKFADNEEAQAKLEAEASSMKIVHRHTFDRNTKTWSTASFTINCPQMRTFLGETLANYQDLDPDLEGWTFAPPYNALVHRWDRLQALHQELKDSAAEKEKKQAVDELVSFMEPILAPSVNDLASIRTTGKVRYNDLWQIFPPGETVLTDMWGVQAACRVTKYHKSRSRNCYDISVEYIDWDGDRCGWQPWTLSINWYSGLSRVTGLPIYPLRFAENQAEIKETMVARGRRFEQLRGYHLLNYRGVRVAMEEDQEQHPVSFPSLKTGIRRG